MESPDRNSDNCSIGRLHGNDIPSKSFQQTERDPTDFFEEKRAKSTLPDGSISFDKNDCSETEVKSKKLDSDSSSMEGLSMPMEVQDVDGLMQLNKDLLELLDLKNTLRTPPPCVDIPPLECHALQMEEIEVIRSIYGEDVTLLNDAGTCFSVKIKFLSDEIKEEDVIKLWFSLPSSYPCVPPVFEIEANQSGSFSYHDADDLFDTLMEACLKKAGQTVVFDLVTIAQDTMPELVRQKEELESRRKAEELAAQRQLEQEDRHQRDKGALPFQLMDNISSELSSGRADEEAEKKVEPDSWHGNTIDHYGNKKPSFFIGSISKIMEKLPSSMQITRVENVMRQDLMQRFHRACLECSKALWKKARDKPYLFSMDPQIAFHGTRTSSLPSIVQQGLVIPGEANKVEVRCGSSLGVGIYTSPFPDFSYHYSDSGRLIVCAVLLGQMYRQDSSVVHSKHYKYYSVISSCNSEWVLFNCAQVLPCYVIEVRFDGHGTVKPSQPLPLQPVQGDKDEEESEVERKKRLLARANKYLPYGFGPGKKTVILAAASIDDDEEDYGDYQEERYSEMTGDACNVTVVETDLQQFRFDSNDDAKR